MARLRCIHGEFHQFFGATIQGAKFIRGAAPSGGSRQFRNGFRSRHFGLRHALASQFDDDHALPRYWAISI
jgi:hypothetical protein